MKSSIKEISRLPKFIFIIYIVQFVVVSLYLFQKEIGPSTFYILGGIGALGLILMLVSLKIELTPKSIQYLFSPFQIKAKAIFWLDVESIHIKKIDPLTDFLGWGIRYSKKYGWAYITSSEYIIFITQKNKKKRAFSIKDPKKVIKFLTKNNISINE
jgi:hypothetical protein